MRIIAAYLLAVLGGNPNPDASLIKKILDAANVSYEESRIEQLCKELHGKTIDEILNEGKSKLSSVGSVAAVGTSTGGGGGGGSAAAVTSAPAEKKEEKKDKDKGKDKDEGSDEEGGGAGGFGALFGGGSDEEEEEDADNFG